MRSVAFSWARVTGPWNSRTLSTSSRPGQMLFRPPETPAMRCGSTRPVSMRKSASTYSRFIETSTPRAERPTWTSRLPVGRVVTGDPHSARRTRSSQKRPDLLRRPEDSMSAGSHQKGDRFRGETRQQRETPPAARGCRSRPGRAPGRVLSETHDHTDWPGRPTSSRLELLADTSRRKRRAADGRGESLGYGRRHVGEGLRLLVRRMSVPGGRTRSVANDRSSRWTRSGLAVLLDAISPTVVPSDSATVPHSS